MNLDFSPEDVAFRDEVITRRTIFELGKARDRAHVLVGLAIAVAKDSGVFLTAFAVLAAAITAAVASKALSITADEAVVAAFENFCAKFKSQDVADVQQHMADHFGGAEAEAAPAEAAAAPAEGGAPGE